MVGSRCCFSPSFHLHLALTSPGCCSFEKSRATSAPVVWSPGHGDLLSHVTEPARVLIVSTSFVPVSSPMCLFFIFHTCMGDTHSGYTHQRLYKVVQNYFSSRVAPRLVWSSSNSAPASSLSSREPPEGFLSSFSTPHLFPHVSCFQASTETQCGLSTFPCRIAPEIPFPPYLLLFLSLLPSCCNFCL